MRTIIGIAMFLVALNLVAADNDKKNNVIEINQSQYKTLVNDYTASTWKYNGQLPAVIDFSATWCGPCRQLAPILSEIAKEYKGKVLFYKVDIDSNKELANAYGITSVPTLLFCPIKGNPTVITGAYPKTEIIKVMEYVFK